MEGRNKDAIASYIDTIRLGRAAMRGGLVFDALVGITFESMGGSGLAQMRSSLSAEECLTLLPKLNDLLDESAWSDELLARDAAWGDHANGWQGRLYFAIDDLIAGHDVPLEER